MENTTTLVRVHIAFLYQLAGMTVGTETPGDVQSKAFAAYQDAHRAVAADYGKLPSLVRADSTGVYRLEPVAGLAEPRDGAQVFALWFSSETGFSKDAVLDLNALCGRCIFNAGQQHGISTYFAGAREMRKFETVEWTEIL